MSRAMIVGCSRVRTLTYSAMRSPKPAPSACLKTKRVVRAMTGRDCGPHLSHLREGDCLVVWKLDRLGRTVRGLIDFVEELRVKGVDFRSITQGIDATTSGGRFFSHVLAALAQMERGLGISEVN